MAWIFRVYLAILVGIFSLLPSKDEARIAPTRIGVWGLLQVLQVCRASACIVGVPQTLELPLSACVKPWQYS